MPVPTEPTVVHSAYEGLAVAPMKLTVPAAMKQIRANEFMSASIS
jgi:hypothetical protein